MSNEYIFIKHFINLSKKAQKQISVKVTNFLEDATQDSVISITINTFVSCFGFKTKPLLT